LLERLRSQDDDGFSLVETLVALVLFAIVASVSARFLITSMGVTRSNAQRVVAANLAAQSIEEVRGKRAVDIADGTTTSQPPAISGTTYTVERTAHYVSSSMSSGLCAQDGAALTFKLVSVTVTWPGMGSVKPVRADTLKALGFGVNGLDATRGSAAVQVLDEQSKPVSGVVVTLNATPAVSQTTGVDGCALFTGLSTATTYSASVSAADGLRTGLRGELIGTVSGIVVQAGKVTSKTLPYAPAGKLAVSFSYPSGFAPASTVGIRLSNPAWAEGSNGFPDCAGVASAPQGCVSGSPRLAARLFPGVYGVWAGSCASTQPTAAGAVTVVRGQQAAATVPLAPLSVNLRSATSQPLPNRPLYLIAQPPSCGVAHQVVSDASGTVRTSLPSGTWMMSLTPTGSAPPVGGWPLVSVDAYGAAVAAQTVTSP